MFCTFSVYVILYRFLLHDFCYEFCEICIFNPPTQIAVAVTNTRATNYSFWYLYTDTQVNKSTFTHDQLCLSAYLALTVVSNDHFGGTKVMLVIKQVRHQLRSKIDIYIYSN